MKRSLTILLTVLVLATTVLSACGPKTEPGPIQINVPDAPVVPELPTQPAVKGTITLWHGWKENEIASLNEVIAAFQAMYPDVTFDVLYVPFDDLRGKFETAAATGGGPSVLIGAADWGPSMYDAGLLADLTADMPADFLATINPAALGATQYNDALIGLPQTVKGVVMFRNKTIVPNASATLDELIANATAVTTADVTGALLEQGFFFSAAHLNGVGGSLMSPAGDPLFNDAKGVEWLNNIVKFNTLAPLGYYSDDDVNLFKAGKAGVIIDGSWNLSALAEAIGKDNLAVDPWPTPLSGFVQTENIYINANTTGDDYEAAVVFLQFFLSKDAQALLADATKAGHLPATLGVSVTDPLLQQASAAFAGGTAFPVIPEMGAYWGPMDNAIKKVVLEAADPAAALQEAFDAVTAKVAEIRGQ